MTLPWDGLHWFPSLLLISPAPTIPLDTKVQFPPVESLGLSPELSCIKQWTPTRNPQLGGQLSSQVKGQNNPSLALLPRPRGVESHCQIAGSQPLRRFPGVVQRSRQDGLWREDFPSLPSSSHGHSLPSTVHACCALALCYSASNEHLISV